MSSNRRTRDLGAAVGSFGSILLLISLFLDWYEPGRSAWSVFETWDLVLAALAAWSIAATAGRLGLASRRPDRWLVLPSASAFVIVVAALLNHPPPAIGHAPMGGIWLALASSIMMLIGAALSVARVSLAIDLEGTRAARRTTTETTRVQASRSART
jgi:hypothetical protein